MNIGTLKNILPRKIRGANLDDIQGVTDYTLFGEAATNLLLKIDPIMTMRRQPLLLYPGVYDYAAWSDLKGKKVIGLAPQGRRDREQWTHTYAEDIDGDDEKNQVGVEFENGAKKLRISHTIGNGANVDETNNDDNWAVSGTASGLAENDLIFAGGGVQFDATVGTALLTWNGDETHDLSEAESIGAFFRLIYIPDATLFTSVTMRVGSASGDYWSITGEPAFGSSYATGINLVKFNWNGATPTGTPDSNAIDYIRLAFVVTGTINNLEVSNTFVSIPTPYEGGYYSNCLFQSTAGAYKTVPTADEDVILLEGEEENALVYECARLIADDMARDERSQKFDARLNGDGNETGIYSDIKAQKPSEAKRLTNRTYRIRRHHSDMR
jgi:hypothetical protein